MTKTKTTRAQLGALIKSNMKIINQRLDEIKRERDSEALDFMEVQMAKFRQLTKTKSKKKLATGSLSKMKKADMELLLKQQDIFLKSSWSTKEGRENIFRKSYETFKKRYEGVSESEYREIREFFALAKNNREIQYLKELNRLSSEQVIEMIKEEAITARNLIKIINDISKEVGWNSVPDGYIRPVIALVNKYNVDALSFIKKVDTETGLDYLTPGMLKETFLKYQDDKTKSINEILKEMGLM